MSNHTINTTQQQWQQRWQAIEQAGGRYQYVQQQLIYRWTPEAIKFINV